MEKAKQIPYRAIALDLDGTLTNHAKHCSRLQAREP